ncbi:MAG: STAS domain-containing protein [Actinobacteria bacterium]|nr:STAS domain-containing protein [Actinomycetota bacterium]
MLVISGPIAPVDVPGLCGRVRAALNRTHAELVVCDVSALADPDAVTVDALARLQLTARRLGRHVRLRHACGELRDLIALMGLQGVVRPYAALPRESPWQTEEREPTPGVEEEGDPGDPIA